MASTRGDHSVKGNLDVSGDAKFSGGVDSPYLEIIDQKGKETDGGTFTGAVSGEFGWKTRDLTITVFDDFATSITLAASPGDGGDITLEKGTYFCDISCPALNVNEHVARLADVTDNPGASGDTVVLGTSEFSADTALWQDSIPGAMTVASSGQTRSHVTGKFILSSQRTLEVQHQCSNTQTDTGFGSAGSFYWTNNVYTIVKMWKLASG